MSTATQAQLVANEQLACQLQAELERVPQSLPSTTGGDAMDVDENFDEIFSYQPRYSSPGGDTIRILDYSSSLSTPQSPQSFGGGGGNGGAEETDDVVLRVK